MGLVVGRAREAILNLEKPSKIAPFRELAEETGLKALSVNLGPWVNEIIDKDKHYLTLVAFVDQFEGTLELLEPNKCEGWEWFEFSKLPSPLFPTIPSLLKKMNSLRSDRRGIDASLPDYFILNRVGIDSDQ